MTQTRLYLSGIVTTYAAYVQLVFLYKMKFGENLLGKTGHAALLKLQDNEIKMLEVCLTCL